ncbi:4-hydroxyphenylacetate decarboxylase activase [Salmonella enterica]|nr:glycyl-radical enzyme activating protein [Salmonella enterica]EBW1589817.1 glycyl-radical enzyme activating protein [Salmonella enterica subsp. diarizonae serovar 61:r:z]EDR7604171.1 4-hydroxyphenylacetate decarboxylase activase [Salmonella enterica subsp. diarizonae]EAT8025626.1 4-hydroxyphenylacetate decarboxylase activase [Salmonella enterica]EBB6121489.1 4-hydroxyphenylacetate decarboxylase activase [Salmonella enterica]
MDAENGLIFDIQSHSIHDGPGSRTTVFMSGCRLSCQWCANPESWQPQEKMLFSEMRCIASQGCTRCVESCASQAIAVKEGKLILDNALCQACRTLTCTRACPPQALKRCGHYYSADALLQRLQHDRDFWGEQGGVTFSGGDPFVQHRFLENMVHRCRKAGIHTAIETTACVREDLFLNVMQFIDFAFIDVKHMDSHVHRQYTGVDNTLILSNIRALTHSNWSGRLVLRVPVIAGINDTDDNIQALAAFMESAGVYEVNLLPFHRLGASKWQQLGKVYPAQNWQPPTDARLAEMELFFTQKQLVCYIGSDTPF